MGNGHLLVAFDPLYQIRDLYWPHVGGENHVAGHTFRVGIWAAPLGGGGQAVFRWLGDAGWERKLRYEPGTLLTDVRLSHPDLPLRIEIADAVDFHENLLVRRFRLASTSDHEIEVRLFLHHDLHISGHEVGDTAYFEPERRAILHYKGSRWFLLNGAVPATRPLPWPGPEDAAPGLLVGLHQWACGHKELHSLEGTWRDAEDGQLSGNAIAQGSVDSTGALHVSLAAGGSAQVYAWLAVGEDFEAVALVNRMVRQRGPERFLQRTGDYWRLWLETHRPAFADLPDPVIDTYLTSLLVIRTQIDHGGGILAANDTDIASTVRDTYSYVWPRDGALVAQALVRAGYLDLSRAFFHFCARTLSPQGYLLHKYNPNGSLGSSWHPWLRQGRKDVPLQEDETALVLWSLWEQFRRHRHVEFIKPLYRDFICRMADFLQAYRDPGTGLPLPSYDLWEERHGIHAWTVGAVWGGLEAGAWFAAAFGEHERAEGYRRAAEELRSAALERLWDAERGCFYRLVRPGPEGGWEVDGTLDSSIVGLWKFGMLPAGHPAIRSTMEVLRRRLWVKTEVGGLARYENDDYHRVSRDVESIPGNPWFICTLWLADWILATATGLEDLAEARGLLVWAAEHALESGVLAEQVHPHSGAPLSVSPLTWSHSTFVGTVLDYVEAHRRLRPGDPAARGGREPEAWQVPL